VPDGEDLQPRLCGLGLDVTEAVRERRDTASYLTKDTFDAVALPVTLGPEAQAGATKCGVEMGRAVNEKHSVVDGVFLAEFTQKYLPSFITDSGVRSHCKKSKSIQSLPPVRRVISGTNHSEITAPHS
jgi:hypothetical protein